MSVRRREVLATLGIGSASSLLWAFGCSAPTRAVRRAPQVSDDVRLWLRDAVERLTAVYPTVHALAVSRHRTTAAHDVLGAGIASLRADGVVLTVRDRDGMCREHVTSSLTAEGVAAAATALGARRARKPIDFGAAPARPAEPPSIDDADLRRRVERLLHADAALSRRIVYAAALIDVDDAIVWSIAPGRDLEQRLVRIRLTATRAGWNATRPVARELERAWSGALDDHSLTDDEIAATSETILEQMTPGTFDDGARAVVLDPSVVALLADTITRTLLTAGARHPADLLASPLFTLVDDPTAPGAYGGFAFDDEGQPAAPLTLVDAGRIIARLADLSTAGTAGRSLDGSTRGTGHGDGSADETGRTTAGAPGVSGAGRTVAGWPEVAAPGRGRRAGHLGRVAPRSSHLVVSTGNVATSELYSDGFLLEAGIEAFLDPATGHLRIACGRARELKAGSTTGRIYPDVELVGSLTDLLSAIDAVAREPVSFALRAPHIALVDPATTDPAAARWASIAAPALRSHAFLRARRTRA